MPSEFDSWSLEKACTQQTGLANVLEDKAGGLTGPWEPPGRLIGRGRIICNRSWKEQRKEERGTGRPGVISEDPFKPSGLSVQVD